MFVILTRKPGQFRTEPGPGLVPLEAHDYWADGRLRAGFVIARLERETRVRVVDDDPAQPVNSLPTKFLPRFATLQAARDELARLARPGQVGARLVPAALSAASPSPAVPGTAPTSPC